MPEMRFTVLTRGLTDKAGNEVNLVLALSTNPRVGISRSVSEADGFYVSVLTYHFRTQISPCSSQTVLTSTMVSLVDRRLYLSPLGAKKSRRPELVDL